LLIECRFVAHAPPLIDGLEARAMLLAKRS
jgi:hypothetical protein